jgi:hypothetical protein
MSKQIPATYKARFFFAASPARTVDIPMEYATKYLSNDAHSCCETFTAFFLCSIPRVRAAKVKGATQYAIEQGMKPVAIQTGWTHFD